MARYDVVVVGAGLGGLTAGAILARAGRKVLVVERSNSVGGAASSYKSGDLFVEGSLHETSDPHHARDPKHDVLTRAGVIDAVKWIPSGAFYQARGGPLDRPFLIISTPPGAHLANAFRKSVPVSINCSARSNASSRSWVNSRQVPKRSKIRMRICTH